MNTITAQVLPFIHNNTIPLISDMAASLPLMHDQSKPLQSRVIRSTSCRTPVVSQCLSMSDRPQKYRSYNDENMLKAFEAVKGKEMSIRRASEVYGVPRTTLQDRVSGKISLSAKSGHRLLTDEEESRLAEFLVGCASIGYAKSRKEVLAIVQQILDAQNANVEVTKGWWDSYLKRHPKLTLRHAEPISYARAVATNPDVFHRYFDLLEETLLENGLTDRPAQIFNCDETGMPLTHKPGKVVAGVGQKHPYSIAGGNKSQITVLACASAAGYSIPPMVVFDRKSLNPDMAVGEVPGTFYGLSNSGWMDSELFEEWFKNHFLLHAPPVRPILLLLDGHSSHYQLELLRIASKEGIIIFCLPPHTTHLLQPLDGCTFSSLKRYWGEECHLFCSRNPGKVVNRYNFSSIFHSAWVQGMSMQNVIASFREVGVYPTNRDKVLGKLPAALTNDVQSQESSSIPVPYVPFCTPRVQSSQHCVQKTPQPSALNTPQPLPLPTQDRTGTASMMLRKTPVTSSLPLSFTSTEKRQFQVRLEEGYDLPDPRYSQWLSTLPSTTCQADTQKSNCRPPKSILQRILQPLTPPAQRKIGKYARGARVLTSEQCRQELFDREQKKLKIAEEKEQKRKKAAETKEQKRKRAEEVKEQKRKKAEVKEQDERRKTEEKQKKDEQKRRAKKVKEHCVQKTPQPSALNTPQPLPLPTQDRTSTASMMLRKTPVTSSLPLSFTSTEKRQFQVRLEEGYDLPDPRYSQWLSTLPSTTCQADTQKSNCRPPKSILQRILQPLTPPAQRKIGKYARGARVLTREQCRQELFDREQKKLKIAEEKEQKRKKAEEKEQDERRKTEEKQILKKDEQKRRAKVKEAQQGTSIGIYFAYITACACMPIYSTLSKYICHP